MGGVVLDREHQPVRNVGATGQLTVRADSAMYSAAVISTAAQFDAA